MCVNRTNPDSSQVFSIFEKVVDYRSIQQIPAWIKKVQQIHEIESKDMSIYLNYTKISESLTSLLSLYYKISIYSSDDFEKKLFPLFVEKININLTLGLYKMPEDSLFLKECDKVFWNDDRDDIDESVLSPLAYAQMLSWSEISNQPIKEKAQEFITDPAEIYRAKLEQSNIRLPA